MTEDEISAAEGRIGVRFPGELRIWLMLNNGSTALRLRESHYVGTNYAAFSPLPHGCAFLDLDRIESTYAARHAYQDQLIASGDNFTYWDRTWIPAIEKFDAPYGFFLDVSAGCVDCAMYNYSEGDVIEVGHTPPSFPSLGVYLTDVADALEGIRPWGSRIGFEGVVPTVRDGVLHW
ncbi:SMI1/KNR4 family protein [Streptomyces sp. NPDC059994]|uniref:SMI1/KNR4 family protein n=1 Tax=Streptomyces sp. NPDC059994 TaxID=3347029 RepID=UPI00367511A8